LDRARALELLDHVFGDRLAGCIEWNPDREARLDDVIESRRLRHEQRPAQVRGLECGERLRLGVAERDYERGMKVWVPTAVDKPIPYKQAVDMSFVKKAQARYK